MRRRKILEYAPGQRHRQMGMDVGEARHDGTVCGIDDLPRVGEIDAARRPDPADAVVKDRHHSIGDLGSTAHRQHVPIDDGDVDGAGHVLLLRSLGQIVRTVRRVATSGPDRGAPRLEDRDELGEVAADGVEGPNDTGRGLHRSPPEGARLGG